MTLTVMDGMQRLRKLQELWILISRVKAIDMDKQHLHILQHALGLDQYGQGNMYRNHFVTGEGSKDYDQCMTLTSQGLMIRHEGSEISGDMDIFVVTDNGKTAVKERSPKPPKMSKAKQRYRQFLKDDSIDIDFGEWLKLKLYTEEGRNRYFNTEKWMFSKGLI